MSIRDRGLVIAGEVKSSSVTQFANQLPSKARRSKTFHSPTLGFVTPWNNHGYDVAKAVPEKFTFISPVWYQFDRKGSADMNIPLTGGHDVDQGWISDVRNTANPPLIVPRVSFEAWDTENYQKMDNAAIEYFSSTMLREADKENFDGLVLDFHYTSMSGEGDALIRLLKSLGSSLHKRGKKLLVAVPPFIPQYALFTSDDYEKLYNDVDYFIVMTYDYSSGIKGKNGGPSAPLNWMTQSILHLIPSSRRAEENHKLLMGLNFFGRTFCERGNAPVLGSQYLDMISELSNVLKWNAGADEHYFTYTHDGMDWTAYYPSLQFIDERLKLADSLGVGISVWELGQGLDYFYELF